MPPDLVWRHTAALRRHCGVAGGIVAALLAAWRHWRHSGGIPNLALRDSAPPTTLPTVLCATVRPRDCDCATKSHSIPPTKASRSKGRITIGLQSSAALLDEAFKRGHGYGRAVVRLLDGQGITGIESP